jgi:trans-2,3-dihydro-3-hydroxyanthranilate isomerase
MPCAASRRLSYARVRHRFLIADVFTDRPFAGNQLAVFPRAEAIPEAAMQPIAREFNFAETTFVLPPRDSRNAARVRIFTPRAELPFAGHPTIGTAAVLIHRGLKEKAFVLEEGIGPVPIEVAASGAVYLMSEKPVEIPAAKPSLPDTVFEEAWFASAGVPFCFLRLKDKAAVDRAAWLPQLAQAWSPNLYVFSGEKELYVRMFAPKLGIEEDPATGSGAVALAGVLAARDSQPDGNFAWQIEQGVKMGRPSRIEASAEKRGGRVVRIRIGGATCVVAEGEMEIPTSLP